MIRSSIKAIILSNQRVLLTKNRDEEGDFYLSPGGGQEHGETFHETLKRECMEETGFEIEIGEVLFIREYIGKNHEHSAFDSQVHQVEVYFICHLKDENCSPTPLSPDSNQIGIEWVALSEMDSYRIYPKTLKEQIASYTKNKALPIYLGDVN
ncbi:NUDIX domain-containing protein [Jeotgalibacillus sp. ET6]|uniref:NUDIX domain-containing protein n=1 Tax=Jeotgalibacillus sp. ET6 TaxID=3037260 RepID=UPI0024186A17|nr:NUDIX domain-containing protein [Jeotgalibacillus sp. ET6]MDG5472189.1 NUDIX domain-containing protein [Jeotgalibacillus sp. ET6]